MFTPELKKFYDEAKAAGEPFEIVFVPFDKSEEDVKKYVEESHGNWYYVPFGSDHIQLVHFNI
jgi:nucleoredoxin